MKTKNHDILLYLFGIAAFLLVMTFRTCPHRVNVRIFRHNFVGGKAKIRRRAVALQGFLTKSPAKFDEKTYMNPYVDRFLNCLLRA